MTAREARPDFEAIATLRVGIAIGVAAVVCGGVLTVGSVASGDTRVATWLGMPATALALVGTIAYALQPRRRIGQRGGVPTVDGVPAPNADVGPLQWRGEGFTTTKAFPITWGTPPRTVWVTARHFPEIDAIHTHLGGAPPPVPTPADAPG